MPQKFDTMRPAEVCERLGIHKTTLHRWRDTNPDFPKPVRIGARAIAYRTEELEQWLEGRHAQTGGKA